MSVAIPLESISNECKKKIVMDLHFQKEQQTKKGSAPKYVKNTEEIVPYRIADGHVHIPLAYAFHSLQCSLPSRKQLSSILEDKSVCENLRPAQKEILDSVVQHVGAHHTALLALHVGFGKSIIAIVMANKIRLRTIIIVHRVLLAKQWKESLEKWCPSHICHIFNPIKKMPDEFDFLICTVLNVPKLERTITDSIGFVIVDECHLISTAHFSKSLNYLHPRYMIGLSATPYRKDGMDKLMDIYFGDKRFSRVLRLVHTVYKLETNFEPRIQLNRNGEMDWNVILDQQCNHGRRNQMIVSLCSLFPDRRILILCKRVKQAEVLLELAMEKNLLATSLVGNSNSFAKDAHILIATVQKAGVGFSHDVLDMLILASDVEEYYIQYLGRVTRRPDVTPVIIDIVDKNKTLQNHFRTRKKVYEEIGGVIKSFHHEFPDFEIYI